MIIKGELGEYEVRYEVDHMHMGHCYAAIYIGPIEVKKWFGLRTVKAQPIYTTYAATIHRGQYEVTRMLPDVLRAWFKRAVEEYELYTKAWNQ